MAWLFPGSAAAPLTRICNNWLPPSSSANGGSWELPWSVIIFNYFLGEEFLWHGILLPKMQGVFGKYDWVANAVIFGLYHVHKPWALPSVIVTNLTYSWPARRFRSNWMAIIVHGAEGLPVLVIVLAVILGWMP